jgi:hypothetical protein
MNMWHYIKRPNQNTFAKIGLEKFRGNAQAFVVRMPARAKQATSLPTTQNDTKGTRGAVCCLTTKMMVAQKTTPSFVLTNLKQSGEA